MTSHCKCTFRIPTPERLYVRILKFYYDSKDGKAWYGDISRAISKRNTVRHAFDLFDGLVAAGYLEKVSKVKKRNIYQITKKGRDLVKTAMQFKDVIDFVDLATRCQSYPEFMMEVVFHGKAYLGSIEFFKNVFTPIELNVCPVSIDFSNVDASRVISHLKGKLESVKWLKDYKQAKVEELAAEPEKKLDLD